MNERELRAFVTIAETGRMDVAARTLGYSQPALSYQLKRLERELRTRLFERDSLGARLTAEGQSILPSAKAVLALLDGIRAVARGSERVC